MKAKKRPTTKCAIELWIESLTEEQLAEEIRRAEEKYGDRELRFIGGTTFFGTEEDFRKYTDMGIKF
jgi:hypothetical protein